MHTEGLGTLKWDGELCSHFPSVCSIPVSSCVTMRDASLQVFGSLALIVLSLRVTAALPVPCCFLPPAEAPLSWKEAGGSFSTSLAVLHSRAVGSVVFYLAFVPSLACSGLYLILVVASTLLSAVLFSRSLFYFGKEILVSENTAAFNSPFQLLLGINILSPSVVKMLRS